MSAPEVTEMLGLHNLCVSGSSKRLAPQLEMVCMKVWMVEGYTQ